MADYKEIKGNRVQYLSTDPTLDANSEGQVWYNSVLGSLKGLVQLKAWSAAANLPIARDASASDGTSIAGWIAGGSNTPAANTGTTATEEYSGYTWAAGGNLNTARSFTGGSGFGTQTAAAVAGGATQPGAGPTRTTLTATEEYNGSAWTSVTGLPTATFGAGQCGIQTAGLSFAGTAGYGNPVFNTTLEYDGSSWTSGGTLNTAVNYQAAGIQTAALAMQSSGTTGKGTEAYNGTSWTAVANRNTARAQIAGFGTQSLATIAGGYTAGPGTPQLTETEQWDGTAWTISTATLGTAARNGMGIGTQGSGTSGLYAGGVQTTYIANTQEFNSTIFSPATGAWASGGNLSTARNAGASAGTQTEALYAGGNTGTYVATTEEYNGTSWGPGGNLNTARGYTAGAGSQTSAVVFGGFTPSSPTFATSATEEYDGSAWVSNPTGLGTARYGLTGCGTQTAALAFGGQVSPGNQTEEYDGSTWTTGGNLNTGRKYLAGCGTQTAGLAVGGNPSGPVVTGATEEYDGSAWTSNPTGLNSSRGSGLGAAGTITSAVAFGGLLTAPAPGTGTTATELYDGSNWISAPPMTTGRYFIGNAGSASSGLAFGGRNAPARNADTEEWSGPQTTATASTLTTS